MKPEFSAADVYALARAILDAPVYENDRARNQCCYCGREAHWQTKPFPHALDCVTRIAQDVLTGAGISVPSQSGG